MKHKSRKAKPQPAPALPADLDMPPDEYAALSRQLAEFNQRQQRQAEQDKANDERLQRALEVARERYPHREAQNFDAFMAEVLKIYNELD